VLSLEDASIVSEIFSELASETRCSILISLDKKPAKLSSIARELDITSQDAFRNINRLVEANLVRRGGGEDSTAFQLTELGMLATKHIPYFLVIKKHQKLFEDHTLKYIPNKFVQRIGALQNCEVVENVTPVLERLKKLEYSAKQYLRIMVSQAWPEEGKIFAECAMNDIDVWTIIGHNTIFPKEVIESVTPVLGELQKSGILGKMLDTVSIAIYISDSQSAVMLPNMKGEVDMGMLLVGTEPSFNEWCLDLFNYFWERAGPASLDKAKIV
jgi:predicted transcriptional regulator